MSWASSSGVQPIWRNGGGRQFAAGSSTRKRERQGDCPRRGMLRRVRPRCVRRCETSPVHDPCGEMRKEQLVLVFGEMPCCVGHTDLDGLRVKCARVETTIPASGIFHGLRRLSMECFQSHADGGCSPVCEISSTRAEAMEIHFREIVVSSGRIWTGDHDICVSDTGHASRRKTRTSCSFRFSTKDRAPAGLRSRTHLAEHAKHHVEGQSPAARAFVWTSAAELTPLHSDTMFALLDEPDLILLIE